MNIDIIGEVHHIGEVERVGANNTPKLTVIIKTVEQYTQFYPIDFLHDKVDLADDLLEGKNFKITCALRGNLGNMNDGSTRAFLSLLGWKVKEA